jgi:alkanesulfonate monooxygenase SsuD/methylene tetrahydromethanopterin reductase-like flavin-dependent oxidoreductase (luciferase family)
VGQAADGWVPSLPSTPRATLAAKHEIIDEAAAAAGRNPAAIRRVANVNGTITGGASEGFLHGPADQWVDELVELALVHGFDGFVLWSDSDPADQTQRFAEIAEQVRAGVARERA